jgi:uncharacterized protein YjeT (DUF2065 family)
VTLGTFFMALAMVAIIEGIGPLLFPRRWQHYLREVSGQPVQQLQRVGGVLVVIGGVSLWFLTQ